MIVLPFSSRRMRLLGLFFASSFPCVFAFVPSIAKKELKHHALLVSSSNDKQHMETTSDSLNSTPYQVSIAYCTGCRWGLRSFWMAQEILTTFNDDPNLQAISIVPSSTTGQFQIQCHTADADVVLWDRKERGGFPEMKQIKQLLRDEVEPSRYLGHSDTESRKETKENAISKMNTQSTSAVSSTDSSKSDQLFLLPTLQNVAAPNLSIVYCTGCKWMFRAAWFAQELLQTFSEELASVSILPTRPPIVGGTFQIYLNQEMLWDRAEQGKFPDIKEIKQLLRDFVNPEKNLGHVDNQKLPLELMDDDDAEEARRLFGVL